MGIKIFVLFKKFISQEFFIAAKSKMKNTILFLFFT